MATDAVMTMPEPITHLTHGASLSIRPIEAAARLGPEASVMGSCKHTGAKLVDLNGNGTVDAVWADVDGDDVADTLIHLGDHSSLDRLVHTAFAIQSLYQWRDRGVAMVKMRIAQRLITQERNPNTLPGAPSHSNGIVEPAPCIRSMWWCICPQGPTWASRDRRALRGRNVLRAGMRS